MNGRRSFVAVPLPLPIRAALFSACSTLAGELPAVRWQRKIENLHITLGFLGDIPDDRIRELGDALTIRLAAVPRFEVGVRGIGAFPGPLRATVVWAGIEEDRGGLGNIAGLIADLVAPPGPPAEHRPFRAHVTLGRSKSGVDVRAAVARMADHSFGRLTVDEVHLYESQLGRQGSTYILRACAALTLEP